nr:MAG TPA: hypothetical protein [Caudoviricetes sp.]
MNDKKKSCVRKHSNSERFGNLLITRKYITIFRPKCQMNSL